MLITVSRQTGSQGREITDLLAQKLNLPVISRDLVMREWFSEVANKHELHMLTESPAFYLTTSTLGITFAEYLERKLRNYIADQPAIILGLGAQLIFARHPTALHIRIMASPEIRVNRMIQTHSLTQKEAVRLLELTDRKHKRYIATIYEKDWADPALYHLTLNTDFLNSEEGASLIHFMAQNKRSLASISTKTNEDQTIKPVVFKHPSEEEFARILDMYHMEWEYEPRTFPIEWDTEGNITLAFSPDFYLPRFDTYIELTTMNQKYASEKKKKVQLLRKLYPGTNINIVFKNDFHTLIKRFGLWKGLETT